MKITCDAHVDFPHQFQKQGPFDLEVNNHGQRSMVDFPRMKEGGLDAAFFALYLSDKKQDELGPDGTKWELNRQLWRIRNQEGLSICETLRDASSARTMGKVPIFLGVEGGRLIQEDLTNLASFRGAGIRYLTLTHNYNTTWADSATDLPKHKGLTNFGTEVVKKCNELDILVDISHASDYTAWDVYDTSDNPVIASHSGCRALLDHPRNIDDHLIKGIARTGGIVCIPFAKRFVGDKRTNIADHIEHVIQLVGSSSVGIGSDLDGAAMVEGIDATNWKEVVMDELSKRGCEDEVIHNVAGMNLLRLLDI